MKKSFPFSHRDKRTYLSTVSGVATTKPSLIRLFDSEMPVEMITTKSFQVRPNPGNREPVICEDELGTWGNSVGLRNPGMESVLPEIISLRRDGLRKWLNISLSADNEDDFITLVKAFGPYADSVELNFSCPHAKKGFGASIGSDRDIAAAYTKRINEATEDRECLLFVKLTPNVDNIGSIAKAVVDAGADGIVAINTVGPVEHIERHSGKPVLNNAIGGKGGRSGDAVFPVALNAVKEIRNAVGDDVPLIAMGGVSDGERAAELISAGADAVAIGSALGRVNQKMWKEYLERVRRESDIILSGRTAEVTSRKLLRDKMAMEYTPHTVLDITLHSPDTMLLTLSGSVESFRAGEFVFLWLPGVGEKPFSLALTKPLTFIIKKRGIFTSSLFCELKEGDTLYIRGPYGGEVDLPKSRKALLVLGGTGEAVAAPLSEMLEKRGTQMSFLVGTSVDGNKGILESTLKTRGAYRCVSDNGKPGRVLDFLEGEIERLTSDGTALSDTAFYLVGPTIFMKNAAEKLKRKGISPDMILLSMEKNTMCGVGLCGECVCGSRLSCQWGTFFTLTFLEKENVL